MSMWFGFDFDFSFDFGELGKVVHKGRHLLLLQDGNLLLLHAEVVVSSQQVNGFLISIVRSHNSKWNVFSKCQNVMDVVVEETLVCDQTHGDLHLYPVIP